MTNQYPSLSALGLLLLSLAPNQFISSNIEFEVSAVFSGVFFLHFSLVYKVYKYKEYIYIVFKATILHTSHQSEIVHSLIFILVKCNTLKCEAQVQSLLLF